MDRLVPSLVIFLAVNHFLECNAGFQNHMSLIVSQYEGQAETIKNVSEKMNKGYSRIAKGISEGLEQALAECKYQFQWNRWTCPVWSSSLLAETAVRKATRETAYLQAITAAGIAYYVSKTCDHTNNVCSCASKRYKLRTKEKFNLINRDGTWWDLDDCKQNVWFGGKVARSFLKRKVDSGAAFNEVKRHNEVAGTKAVTASLENMCKCHGPTGSCSLKTCWKRLPHFRKISRILKEEYKMSLKVLQTKTSETSDQPDNHVPKSRLVYSENSPSYCFPEPSIGIHGTVGRECEIMVKELNVVPASSCEILCTFCGHKISRQLVTEVSNCTCESAEDCGNCEQKKWRYFCAL